MRSNRSSSLARLTAGVLIAGALISSPAFATDYYTVNAGTTHWWTKVIRSTKKAVSSTVKAVTGKGNGQWTATTQYSDGSSKTTTGGN